MLICVCPIVFPPTPLPAAASQTGLRRCYSGSTWSGTRPQPENQPYVLILTLLGSHCPGPEPLKPAAFYIAHAGTSYRRTASHGDAKCGWQAETQPLAPPHIKHVHDIRAIIYLLCYCGDSRSHCTESYVSTNFRPGPVLEVIPALAPQPGRIEHCPRRTEGYLTALHMGDVVCENRSESRPLFSVRTSSSTGGGGDISSLTAL